MPSAEHLESQREALLRRLELFGTRIAHLPGYRTAQRLLNQKFRLANFATRVEILRAAQFLIDVLEQTMR